MQPHIKVYREFWKIGEDDIVLCFVCRKSVAVDIHHITSRGLKFFEYEGELYDDINDILNLIGLCRDCHSLAHGGTYTKNHLYKINAHRILRPENR